jgi:hypothetical protein
MVYFLSVTSNASLLSSPASWFPFFFCAAGDQTQSLSVLGKCCTPEPLLFYLNAIAHVSIVGYFNENLNGDLF